MSNSLSKEEKEMNLKTVILSKFVHLALVLNMRWANVKFLYRIWVYGGNESYFRQLLIILLCSKSRLLEKKLKNFSPDLLQKVIKTIPISSCNNCKV